jgi:hypothetical protein
MTIISQRIRLGACLVSSFVALGALGFGDVAADEPDPRARAQALFVEGRKAIDGGNWAAGCPKVRQSLELFAVANSHFTSAQCDERDGRIASALEHWERGRALVDDAADPRTKVARERIAALDPRVPRVRVVIPPASGSVTVLLDDVELSAAVLVAPLRVNPGKHVFVVRAEGRQENRHQFTIAERERIEFIAKGGPARQTPPSGSASAAPPVGSATPPTPSNPRRTAGFVLGGVGALGLLASAGTAYGVYSVEHDLLECQAGGRCTTADRAAYVDKYKSLLVVNTVTFGVGLAGVGAGLILVLTAPKTTEAKPADTAVVPLFMPGGAGIGLSGRF